ncbi:MAG: hypothetical protein J5I81_13235 [Nitrococcus mobilis]|nr:hypothetical protein [Nitrococcus mobilis]
MDIALAYVSHRIAGQFVADVERFLGIAQARAATIRERALREQVRGEIETAVSKVQTASQAISEAQAGVVAAGKNYQAQLELAASVGHLAPNLMRGSR